MRAAAGSSASRLAGKPAQGLQQLLQIARTATRRL